MRLLEAQDRISSGGHAFQGQQAGRGETRQVPTDNAQIPSSLGLAGGAGGPSTAIGATARGGRGLGGSAGPSSRASRHRADLGGSMSRAGGGSRGGGRRMGILGAGYTLGRW